MLFSVCAEIYSVSLLNIFSPKIQQILISLLFYDWSSLLQGLRGSDKVSCQIKYSKPTRIEDGDQINDENDADHQMKVTSDPDLETVWKLLTTTGSSPSNFGLTVAYVSVRLPFPTKSSSR